MSLINFCPVLFYINYNFRAEMARGMMRIKSKIKNQSFDELRIDPERSRRGQKSKIWGQSIPEYAVLISVVTMALLAMQIYMKRGIQAVVRYSTDQWGNQEYMETDPDKGYQMGVNMQTLSDGTMGIQQVPSGESVLTTYVTNETTTNTGVSVYWSEEPI